MDITTLRDILMGVLWAGANILLIGAAWRLSRTFFPGDDVDQRVVHAIVAAWACVTGSAMVLGSIGALTGLALLGIVATLAGVVLTQVPPDRANAAGQTSPESVPENYFRRGFPWQNAAPAEPVMAGANTSSTGAANSQNSLSRNSKTCSDTGAGTVLTALKHILLAYFLSHSLMNGVGAFPSDWDTLMYHLPRIDQWIQTQSLYVSDCYNWSHPGNNELIGLWMVAPFSGDFFIALNNLPAAGLLGFAAISLGRGVGLSRGLSYVTALAIMSNTVVYQQLVDAKNDLPVAGLFLTCLAYGIRTAQRGKLADLIWGSLSIGLLSGVKYNAVGYAALALVTAVALMLAERGIRAMFRLLGLWLVCLMLWGGFWYVRNLVMVGNPLYPLGFTPESNVLALMYPEVRRSSLWGCDSPKVVPLLIDAVWRMAGPAQLAAVLLMPITVVWLLVSAAVFRDGQIAKANASIRAVLALGIVGTTNLVLVTPFSAEDAPNTLNHLCLGYTPVRFGMCVLSLSLLATGIVIQDLVHVLNSLVGCLLQRSEDCNENEPAHKTISISRNAAFVIPLVPQSLWCAMVASQFLIRSQQAAYDFKFSLLFGITVFVAGWIISLSCELHRRGRRWIGRTLMLLALLSVAGCCGRQSMAWHRDFTAYYNHHFGTDVYSHLSTWKRRSGRVSVLFYLSYPFYGSGRQNCVFQPMWIPSSQWLFRYLARAEIDQLVVPSSYQWNEGWQSYRAITPKDFPAGGPWHHEYHDAVFDVMNHAWTKQGH